VPAPSQRQDVDRYALVSDGWSFDDKSHGVALDIRDAVEHVIGNRDNAALSYVIDT
jgi:hypothetical protein